jgi:phosphoribosylaminoimidazolecarboxamide formyltransferase/IMP cyclohydrolase
MQNSPPIRRALISVSDKTGLAELVQGLNAAGVELFSTGGTRAFIAGLGLTVRDVGEYTGFAEMLDGRVKTLHPKIHGGILARHDRPDDMAALVEHGILTFELVIVNLYPFEQTVARADVTFDDAIENIDIGGPSLIRGASKNHAFTTIVTDASQYAEVLTQIRQQGSTSIELRKRLAQAAFARTAEYDAAISRYLHGQVGGEELFAASQTLPLRRKNTLRYGENPHQRAALYEQLGSAEGGLVNAKFLNGKELSYNNLLDLDAALAIARSLDGPSCVVIKHNNPCGAATADVLSVATRNAFDGDPVSAFGSVLGFNRQLDAATAEVLAEPGRFVEAIAAPDYTAEALQILTTRPKWKTNVRLLEVGTIASPPATLEVRQIVGGLLVQEADNQLDPSHEWRVATTTQPTPAQLADLHFGWQIVRYVKSNAIVVASDRTVWGVGAGQMSRVDSTEIALRKAGDHGRGAVLASDAFFPFPDSIEQAAAAGIAAIIQPGGSKKDDEVIAAANQHGIAMILTGRRHFKH